MIQKIPTQNYRPRNFWSEISKIIRDTDGAFSVTEQAYIDKDGNYFKIDYENRSIRVN